MKFVKMLGLLAVAASALMAFAGTASADILTSPTGTLYTGKIHAHSEGHAILHNPIAKIECTSTVGGEVTSHGPGQKVTGHISTLNFTNCTDNWHVTVVAAGHLSVEWIAGGSGYDGDVYSNGATVEATRFGISCRYATNTTTVGRLTAGSTPTMDIDADIPFHSGSVFCGSGATEWTGNYTVSTPASLYVDNT
jgi:hypothetical protein